MTYRLEPRRGKHIGKLVGKRVENEAEHFMACPNCGAPIDMSNLGQVLEHWRAASALDLFRATYTMV
jgi:hypothetical protein